MSGNAVVEHSRGTECSDMQIVEGKVIAAASLTVGPELSCQQSGHGTP